MPFTKTTTGRVFTFGEDLLGALSDARLGARGRPIIFLGHSLGGIVIKSVRCENVRSMSGPR
jgi:hypothetical protein